MLQGALGIRLIGDKGADVPGGGTPWRFDQYDFRAQRGQDHAGELAALIGEIDHPVVLQQRDSFGVGP